MKILRFLLLLAISINADEIYFDNSNEFLNTQEGEKFLAKYFHKPLKTLQEVLVEVEVMDLKRVENVQQICTIFEMRYDREQDACFNTSGAKFCDLKTKKAMQEYILQFVEIPDTLHNSDYMFMENNLCGYVGKIKIFGYTWDFESRGGGIELTRKIDAKEHIFSIDENPLKAYRQGKIEGNKARKCLICTDAQCNPRAEKIEH